jgi:hypothetical protein
MRFAAWLLSGATMVLAAALAPPIWPGMHGNGARWNRGGFAGPTASLRLADNVTWPGNGAGKPHGTPVVDSHGRVLVLYWEYRTDDDNNPPFLIRWDNPGAGNPKVVNVALPNKVGGSDIDQLSNDCVVLGFAGEVPTAFVTYVPPHTLAHLDKLCCLPT